MFFYFIVFFLIVFFCYIDIKQKSIIIFALSILLTFIAGLSGPVSADHNSYIALYNEVINGKYRNEISFIVISKFVNLLFHNPLFLFLIYAILGVNLKVIAIKKISHFCFFSILIYFSYYFFLHDMTQIRVGVSSAFFLLSIPSIYERNFKRFIVLIGAAILFHYSALILLPMYFIKRDKIHIWWFFLIPIGYLLYFSNINISSLIQFINIDVISYKYNQYKSLSSIHKINIFNSLMLFRYCFIGLLLWKWKLLREKNVYAVILIKFYILSCFIFISLADLPAIAFRLSELLAIVEIMLIPFIIYLFNIELLGKIFVTIIGFLFLCLVLLYQKLVMGYF